MRALSNLGATLAVLLFLGTLTAACGGDPATPEAQIRRTLTAMEEAVERGDASSFKEHVSESYADDLGNDRSGLMATVTFHLMRNRQRHAWVRVHEVALRESGRAEVSVAVGLAGSPIQGPEDLRRLQADVYAIELDLVREGDDWRVVWARWKRAPIVDLI